MRLWTALLVIALAAGCGKYVPAPEVPETRKILKSVIVALDQFKKDHRKFPAKLEELQTRPPYVDAKKWPEGGYLKRIPKDAWGNTLVYQVPGTGGLPYDLLSTGEDGLPGGEKDAQDISLEPKSLPKKKK